MSGKFNLTSVSFPIKCMAPMSIVDIYASVVSPMASYLNAAALSPDPIERMKLVMVASISYIKPCHTWGKPLNPILGETIQASLDDGS